MTGRMPAYGQRGFRLVQVAHLRGWAPRIFLYKAAPDWYIRSTANSEKWQVYCGLVPVGKPHDSLGDAMNRLRAALALLKQEAA